MLLFVCYLFGWGVHVKWADEVVGRFAHLRDNGNTHVGHVGNDVTVLWWDVSMLKELTQVLLSHTWHTQWDTQMHAVQIPGPNMQFTRMGTCMFRKKRMNWQKKINQNLRIWNCSNRTLSKDKTERLVVGCRGSDKNYGFQLTWKTGRRWISDHS